MIPNIISGKWLTVMTLLGLPSGHFPSFFFSFFCHPRFTNPEYFDLSCTASNAKQSLLVDAEFHEPVDAGLEGDGDLDTFRLQVLLEGGTEDRFPLVLVQDIHHLGHQYLQTSQSIPVVLGLGADHLRTVIKCKEMKLLKLDGY